LFSEARKIANGWLDLKSGLDLPGADLCAFIHVHYRYLGKMANETILCEFVAHNKHNAVQ
jgi:hypothetical protein